MRIGCFFGSFVCISTAVICYFCPKTEDRPVSYTHLDVYKRQVLLYTLSGEEKEIAYHPSGKPYLADDSADVSKRQ